MNIDLILEGAVVAAVIKVVESEKKEEEFQIDLDDNLMDIVNAVQNRKMINKLKYDAEFYENLISGLEFVNTGNKTSIDNYYEINNSNFKNLKMLISNDILSKQNKLQKGSLEIMKGLDKRTVDAERKVTELQIQLNQLSIQDRNDLKDQAALATAFPVAEAIVVLNNLSGLSVDGQNTQGIFSTWREPPTA